VACRVVRLSADPNLVLRAQVGAEDLAVRIVPVRRMPEATAQALLRYLLALGEDPVLRIPRPARLAGGDWFAAIDLGGEAHRLSLLTWVPGEGARDPASFVEPARLRAMGAFVARMHRRAATLPPRTARAVRPLRVAARFDPPVAGLGPDLTRRLAATREILRHALESEAGPTEGGVVHGDLWPQNWVFEDGRPGVIDFDELRYGPFALDLVNVVSNHALWDGYDGFVEELFAGYETVRPLPPGTREHTRLLTAALLLDWMRMVLTSPDEEFRAPLEVHLRPVAERIVHLCGPG